MKRNIENIIFDTIIYLGAFVLTFVFVQLMAHADKWMGL